MRPQTGRHEVWREFFLVRTVPAAFFSLFLVAKMMLLAASVATIAHHPHNVKPAAYMYALNQLLGLVYFGLLVVLFATRRSSAGGKGGLPIVAVAFFGTFSMLLSAILPGVAPRAFLLVISNLLLAGGLAYSIWSLIYLGRSLSILPEARHLVTGGPYGWSRHPLYLGEAVASIGSVIPTIAGAGVVLALCFLVAQYLRINWEEEVLREHFGPEYADYQRHVPKYLPHPFHRRD